MKRALKENEIKEVTIDELAGIINRSFIAVQDRLDDMLTKVEFNGFKDSTETALYELDRHAKVTNERLGSIEGHLGDVDSHLVGIDSRLDGVEIRLDGVEDRLGTVERKIDVIGMEIMGTA